MIPLRDDNPTRTVPVVTIALILACTTVFLWQLSFGPSAQPAIAYAFGMIPARLAGLQVLPPMLAFVPPAFTVLTSMFFHGGWLHLIGNMLYLWIFGNNVEDAMGHVRFAIFYFVCGVVAALFQALPAPDSVLPMIGASGAISGVLGAYLLLYPRARILVALPLGLPLPLMRLPALWVLGFWFAVQLLSSALAGPHAEGIAWRAHVGGFLAGMVLIALFKRRTVRLLAPARRARA